VCGGVVVSVGSEDGSEVVVGFCRVHRLQLSAALTGRHLCGHTERSVLDTPSLSSLLHC